MERGSLRALNRSSLAESSRSPRALRHFVEKDPSFKQVQEPTGREQPPDERGQSSQQYSKDDSDGGDERGNVLKALKERTRRRSKGKAKQYEDVEEAQQESDDEALSLYNFNDPASIYSTRKPTIDSFMQLSDASSPYLRVPDPPTFDPRYGDVTAPPRPPEVIMVPQSSQPITKQKATISDDRSVGSEYESNRKDLVALKPREKSRITHRMLANQTNTFEYPGSDLINAVPTNSGNHALQDYQMQLMLLEQQNKKRLMMARQEHDQYLDVPTLEVPSTIEETQAPITANITSNPTIDFESQPQYRENLQEVNRTITTTSSTQPSDDASNEYDFVDASTFSRGRGNNPPPLPRSQHQAHTHAAIEDINLDLFASFLARDLGISEPCTVNFDSLKAYIVGLQKSAVDLQNLILEREPSKFQVIHRIIQGKQSMMYFDAPQWTAGENGTRALRSSLPLSSISSYLDKHLDLAFIVYRDYDVSILRDSISEEEDKGVMPPAQHTGESLQPTSKDLIAAVTLFLRRNEHFSDVASAFRASQTLAAPYLIIYHTRNAMDQFLNLLSQQQRRQFKLLLDYVLYQYRQDYETVDSLLDRGKITFPYIKYIFKPGDVLVEGQGNNSQGVISESWLSESAMSSFAWLGRGSEKEEKLQRWEILVYSWRFSGVFSRWSRTLTLELDVSNPGELDIAELNLRPLSFVSDEMRSMLKRRGETVWRCRIRHFVSYNEDKGPDDHHSGDDRYMIDLKTYRELHKTEMKTIFNNDDPVDDLGDVAMERDSPPNANFLYLVPSAIKGYNLKKKQWLELQVDRIAEVVWNKDAFESLVLDRKTKGLIEALISNHLDAERSTDLISGKGNGLILLLHGSPGTGKTLTAESVAEIAEKPLYPVTCGDIGTKPEEVEEYLESVLSLGKKWECVVLLDEADVFLEQRSLEDLQRNALVSVFLRVLEYYDGILVLTSNRVGTFDEAFKSRIQLALHYANLSEYQRSIIWKNFIDRLERLEEKMVNFDDLKDHLEQLAKHKMNGRQIRNAITTARQWAKWKGVSLDFAVMTDIIMTAGRFDLYIEKLNGGYSQDQLAEDEGLRLSEARAREV